MSKRWGEVPERFAVVACSCGARIVWVPGSKGGKLCLDRARARTFEGRLQLEPHWGYCPHKERHRARSRAKGQRKRAPCYAVGCRLILSPADWTHGRPFCRGHWRDIPRSVQVWILRRFDAVGRRDPQFIEAARSARQILEQVARGGGQQNLFGESGARRIH